MSYYPDSSSNRTGLGYARDTAKDPAKQSDVKVTVTERQGVAPETFTLTTEQEAFAQKIASTGKWEEMPHSSGRRQIRQRVLDILFARAQTGGVDTAATAPTTASTAPKAKSKSENVFVLTRTTAQGTDVVAAPRLKSQAKDIANDEMRSVDPELEITWVNDKENATGTVTVEGNLFTYQITRKTLLKPKA